jgi:hypothetical protein
VTLPRAHLRRATAAMELAAVIFTNRNSACVNDRPEKSEALERALLLLTAEYRYSGQHSNGKLANSGIIVEAARISPNLRGVPSGTDGTL